MFDWLKKAHRYQIPPKGDWWTVWMLLAGRGAGKTRGAAHNILWWSWSTPKSRSLVLAPTANDLRFTCFEGDSGLLNVCPPELIASYNKSTHELTLVNGSSLRGISADSYERLRGPQFHYAWCDELAAFEYLQEAWDMMMFGLRLGARPRVIVTTTPKPRELIVELHGRQNKDVVVDTASSYANLSNLAPTFRDQIIQYEGTKLGRQEIHAEIIDPFEAGIIKKQWIRMWPANEPLPLFDFVLLSLDTAFTEKTIDKETYDRDPTAGQVWGTFVDKSEPDERLRRKIMLLDCWEDYMGLPDLITKCKQEIRTFYGANQIPTGPKIRQGKKNASIDLSRGRKPDLIVIEDKGSGISLRQMLAREHIFTYPYNPDKADKLARLHSVAHIFAHGLIYLPESETRQKQFKTWTDDFVRQICSFAGEESIKHDDHVDACTQALIYLATKNRISLTVSPPPRLLKPPKSRGNPYAQ